MNFSLSFFILLSLITFVSCSESIKNIDSSQDVNLSDTLFSHFTKKSRLDPTIRLQLARYSANGNLEWLSIYQSNSGKMFADYSLSINYDKNKPSQWNIFNVVRYQGTKKDSLQFLEYHEEFLKNTIRELESNPALPKEPCFDCPSGNLSQIILSDSSLIIQGNEEMLWDSFDSLIVKMLK